MRIGLFISDVSGEQTTIEELLANARAAEALGFSTGWVPHIPWSLDGLTALALAGQVTNRIELGTAVMPTYPRHPLAMAQQAMSTQAATDGRLVLGIGPSHPVVIESMHGLEYARPAHHTREYVEVLRAAFAGSGHVEYQGEMFGFSSMLTVPGSTPAPIMIAALAPKMLKLAGELTDGTITYWANERAVGEHIVPAHHRRRQGRGRPPPRVVVGLPVAVCDDADAGRERAAEALRGVPEHPDVPAHPRAGGDDTTPADVAMIGTEAEVTERLRSYAARRRHRPLRDRASASTTIARRRSAHDRAAGVTHAGLELSRTGARMTKEVRLEIDGPIATITNDNVEKHNAFDDDMDPQLFEILGRAEGAARRAGGRSGGARASRGLVGPRRVGHRRRRQVELTPPRADDAAATAASCRCSTSRRRSSWPCRAGRSAASFQRALLCDIRIAAEGARFMLPEVDPRGDPRHRRRRSAVPDLRPRGASATWCSPAGPMDADEALAHGIVSRVVPADELDATAREMAEKIAAAPAVTVKMARRVIAHLSEPEVRSSMADEMIYQTFINQVRRLGRVPRRPRRGPRRRTTPGADDVRRRTTCRACPAPPELGASALPAGTFDGAAVFVTGGGTGLGKAIALEFARLGADDRDRQPQARAPRGRPRGRSPRSARRSLTVGVRHPRPRADRRRLRRRRPRRSACRAC